MHLLSAVLLLSAVVLAGPCSAEAIPFCVSCDTTNTSKCLQCGAKYLPDSTSNIQDCIYNPGYVLNCGTLDTTNPMRCTSCKQGFHPDNGRHITSCMSGGSIAGVVIVFLLVFFFIVVLAIGYVYDKKYRKSIKAN